MAAMKVDRHGHSLSDLSGVADALGKAFAAIAPQFHVAQQVAETA